MSVNDIVLDGKFWIDKNGRKYRYVDPMSDEGFKVLFGMEGCEDLLMELLNEVIPGVNIVGLSYKNTEHQGRLKDDGKAIFDVYCEDSSGSRFLVEVQNWRQRYFNKRAVFYSTYAIQDQAIKEKNHQLNTLRQQNWDYNYSPVYVVCFLNCNMKQTSPLRRKAKEEEYLSIFRYLDIETKEELQDGTTLVFVEMRKFQKGLAECNNDKERLLCTMKAMGTELEMPFEASNTLLEKIYSKAEIAALPKEVRIRYISQIMKTNDILNSLAESLEDARIEGREKGLAEGREEGRAEGREEGREEGRAEGRAEGIHLAKISNAKKLKEHGMELETIAQLIDLPLNVVEEL